ncbi:hypothetical protein CSOJ01_04394 [Colletotrichum sojae]|uniref:Uncharacterized protein n=1 Tax=Colletotrichum sojae TaxID=2175907 RepID=A0A8H6MYK9_9PEZI|nr:hypothetical protein CSOJ01_04394 [Colletotrichum sojae]
MERHARDEFVSELTSYYTFLTHVFLPPSAIRHPPPGGWAHITPSFIDSYGLGKDAAVADLMRHMPYIQRDEADENDPWMIYEKTAAVDYAGEVILGRRNKRGVEHLVEPEMEEMFCGMPPAHVYVLATHAGGRDGHFVFVDTRRAVVVVADWQVGPRSTELSLSDNSDEFYWYKYATYTFGDFFSMLKDHFRGFKVVATTRRKVQFGRSAPDHVVKIYQEEGIFTERYDRERCMDRLDNYCE